MINVIVKDAKTIQLDMVGEITAQDYKSIRPKLEKIFAERGKMKFLIHLDKAKDFSVGALYEDVKFDLQHLKEIGTTAIVAQKKLWQKITKVIDKVYPEKVEYFEDDSAARNWLSAQ